MGSVGDSYDNTLAETVIGLYKAELIHEPGQGPCNNVEDIKLATLGWTHWHSRLGDIPPGEFRAAYAARQSNQTEVLGTDKPKLSRKPWRFACFGRVGPVGAGICCCGGVVRGRVGWVWLRFGRRVLRRRR